MEIIVLGCGLVGSAIAKDLAQDDDFRVTVADFSPEALQRVADIPAIRSVQKDLSDSGAVTRLIAPSDLVVGAVPGHMGFETVKTCILANKPVVDISFFPEDALELDALARQHRVTVVVDFGVAPGCSNLIYGHAASRLARVDRFACYVGGLPVDRTSYWQYKAPFSPADVLQEYLRPARFIRGGAIVTTPALAEPELIDFADVGPLEAFLTDGLRTLLRVKDVPEMIEKTCRYPGYRDKIICLRESGFLSDQAVELSGNRSLKPLELTSKLLFDAWRLGPEQPELTVMRVDVSGRDAAGQPVEQRWELHDRYDANTKTSSMARTTGYTCTAGVRLLARKLWTEVGVHPPENIGAKQECFDFVLAELAERGVRFRK